MFKPLWFLRTSREGVGSPTAGVLGRISPTRLPGRLVAPVPPLCRLKREDRLREPRCHPPSPGMWGFFFPVVLHGALKITCSPPSHSHRPSSPIRFPAASLGSHDNPQIMASTVDSLSIYIARERVPGGRENIIRVPVKGKKSAFFFVNHLGQRECGWMDGFWDWWCCCWTTTPRVPSQAEREGEERQSHSGERGRGGECGVWPSRGEFSLQPLGG